MRSFHNVSDFELNFWQRAKIWIKLFQKCQILNHFFKHASGFEEKFNFEKHDYEEKSFSKSMIWNVNFFLECMILNKSVFVKSEVSNDFFFGFSDFEIKFFRPVSFWIKVFTTCQILNQLFKHPSDFELNYLQRVRFWVYFFRSLPSFHVFDKTGFVAVMFECKVWVWLVKFFC